MKTVKLINSVIPIITGTLLVVIVVCVFLRIVLRNFFNTGLSWSDEITQFAVTWMVLFGAIWATQNNNHLSAGIKLHQKLSGRQMHFIDGILALLIAGVTAVVGYRSALYAFSAMGFSAMSLPWLKMGCVFLAFPLALFVICCFFLKSFFENMALIFKKD
jgi:TRAP-type C4-dicarboxylate transport system permease small subunit